MTIEQVRDLHRQRPFQAFDIHLAVGRSLPVEHPEFLAQSPTGRTIAVGMTDGTHQIVDLMLVASLAIRANGEDRPRRRSK